MVTPNIEIDVGKDKVVTTAPPYRVSMTNIEVEDPPASSTQRVDIPERSRRDAVDSGSDGSDYAFLANPKKLAAPKEIPVPTEKRDEEDRTNTGADGNKHNSDSDSDRSRHTWKSHHSHKSSHSKKSERSEYAPRYSVPGGARTSSGGARPSSSSSPPLMNSMFASGLFSRRTHAMSEDDIRKEKSYLLQQYLSKNREYTYSPVRLTMDNSLEEIQNELQFIISKREMENNMITWKRGFLMFADGVVALNSSYDPFNFKVDLSDWAVDLHYDVMRDGKYDEVLEELIMKWRGKVPMSPEMKLLFMAGSSLVFGVMAKKKEAAVLAKRMEADKAMERRIQLTVQKEVQKRMRMMESQMPQHIPPQQQAPQHPHFSLSERYPMEKPVMSSTTQPRPVSPLHGPSLSPADLMKLMKPDIIDSSAEEDDDTSSLSSDSTLSTNAEAEIIIKHDGGPSTQNTTIELVPEASSTAVKDKDGSKPKAKAKAKVLVDDDDEDMPSITVATPAKRAPPKRAAATVGALPARPRGRPRKNAVPNPTVVTLESF
ncbi:hypothetical protein HDU87_000483 [Geranomyces variabilis]|uniref:Uncharacterized protein n=1 Tax=Geranomyces variabilis TaxID=109894 RepID=A0AAD5TCM3_9FUNG|nr:hypothetical protein HDU87_000483 [Geranomyces variabilis]